MKKDNEHFSKNEAEIVESMDISNSDIEELQNVLSAIELDEEIKPDENYLMYINEMFPGFHKLAPKSKEVICYRFGCKGFYPHTMEETVEAFSITAGRIRQIEAIATRARCHSVTGKLKEYLNSIFENET